jgi:acyl dehydratase
MAPRTVSFARLSELAGSDLGRTSFRTISQSQIDRFVDVTDDHQWIHADTDRARRGAFGGPIAPGFLTLALLTPFAEELLHVDGATSRVNYGLDRVRFISPVRAGARVRVHAIVDSVDQVTDGIQLVTSNEFEIDGEDRLAAVARFIVRYLG